MNTSLSHANNVDSSNNNANITENGKLNTKNHNLHLWSQICLDLVERCSINTLHNNTHISLSVLPIIDLATCWFVIIPFPKVKQIPFPKVKQNIIIKVDDPTTNKFLTGEQLHAIQLAINATYHLKLKASAARFGFGPDMIILQLI